MVRQHGEQSLSADIHDLFNRYGRHALPYSWPGTGTSEPTPPERSAASTASPRIDASGGLTDIWTGLPCPLGLTDIWTMAAEGVGAAMARFISVAGSAGLGS